MQRKAKPNPRAFAARLRKLMEEKTLTVDDLVRKSPTLKYSAITQWIRGDRFPQVRGIAGLALALGVEPDDLLQGIAAVPDAIRSEANTLHHAYVSAPPA